MKIRKVVPLIVLFCFAAAGYAQDNSCAYTFTYPKPQFSFCVTIWGTLASIQSPIGVNHLDPTNPVEGWVGHIVDNEGGGDGFTVIPGLGIVEGPPVVRQPNGPGTLPLIFDFGGDRQYVETIDAVPYQREIITTLTIRSCSEDCVWWGSVNKVANIRPDGSTTGNFAHSAFAAFAYAKHGVMLKVSEKDWRACAGVDPNGASTVPHDYCPTDDTPFSESGSVYGYFYFYSPWGKTVRMTAMYQVF
jgi:hypothetical protein